ncbi:MAG: LptE family protein, partial [Candidatus Hydrothermia bacterium]
VYSFSGFFPKELRKTHVKLFTNNTARQGLQTTATDVFGERIRKDGRLELVGENEAALIAEGEVSSFKKDPEEYDASGKILTYRVTIRAKVSFYDVANQKYYLGPKAYEGWAIYTVGSETEEDGIRKAFANLFDQALAELFSSGF